MCSSLMWSDVGAVQWSAKCKRLWRCPAALTTACPATCLAVPRCASPLPLPHAVLCCLCPAAASGGAGGGGPVMMQMSPPASPRVSASHMMARGGSLGGASGHGHRGGARRQLVAVHESVTVLEVRWRWWWSESVWLGGWDCWERGGVQGRRGSCSGTARRLLSGFAAVDSVAAPALRVMS